MAIVRYDPRVDIVFRKVFGEHKSICLSFLNALLPLKDGEKIVEVEYLPFDTLKRIQEGKESVLDINCQDQQGNTFIVEIELHWIKEFLMESLSKVLKELSHKVEVKDTGESQLVYRLCLLNNCDANLQFFKHQYPYITIEEDEIFRQLRIESVTLLFIDLMEFHSIPKLPQTITELWLSFLTLLADRDETMAPEALLIDKDITTAVEIIRDMTLTPGEMAHYDKYWDNISCWRSLFAERYEAGYEEGYKKGLELAANQLSMFTNARKMKKLGLASEQISQITGLSEKEIDEL
ncbi:MAG: Rpn family recombination-promoting nuclease/putative transposase [Bacteroidales bacterium]|nr:Rpn family recombination-promoting nuclease/putative transposase [Bacteroidales bacterium]